jgi:hypothetical protein
VQGYLNFGSVTETNYDQLGLEISGSMTCSIPEKELSRSFKALCRGFELTGIWL